MATLVDICANDHAKRHLINQGDICVVHISENHKYVFKIQKNAVLQTRFGSLNANDLIGCPYGVKFDLKKGWILPLKLTPELWTQLLPHRTQILYQADISMILLQLDIKPGAIVVESGTGSGSMSHAILRACLPNGFLYTFDLNESRVKDAQKEFEEHNFHKNIRTKQRNVCNDGFGEDLVGVADACLLDLPQTWEAIEHAFKILKPHGSRLCTFSPCIEQVKQNVAKMVELKMKDIVTLETLLRPYEVREQTLRVWDEDILDKLVAIDQKRIENINENLQAPKKIKIDHDNGDATMEVDAKEDKLEFQQQDSKNQKKDDSAQLQQALTNPKKSFHSHMLPKCTSTYARQFNETVSHSGFLTFATKRP